jgi:hypothetical protein
MNQGGIIMSQITLRQLPENLENQIRKLARKNKTSINKTVIDLLEKALGIGQIGRKKRDLSKLKGTWGQKEADEFDQNIQQFNLIDEEVWK